MHHGDERQSRARILPPSSPESRGHPRAHEAVESANGESPRAIASASADDVVLIAGKGHENLPGDRRPPPALPPMRSKPKKSSRDGADDEPARGRDRMTGRALVGEDVRFDSVSTDSRTLERGALFVALRGERLDGRRSCGAARERGAAAAIVEEPDASSGGPSVPRRRKLAFCTRAARGALARAFRHSARSRHRSNGKTTVKEMIAAILREHFGETHALATEGNLNNDIGLPLTLLKLRRNHRAAVVELGVNHPGETATLAAIASPTIALINNAQREHQEFMKGVAEVAREHGTVFAAMKPDGTGVINADDEFSVIGVNFSQAGAFGTSDSINPRKWAAATASLISESEIELRAPEGATKVELHVDGRHSVLNAFAAAACALAAGASLEAVARGLAAFPSGRRTHAAPDRSLGGRPHRRQLQRQSGFSACRDRRALPRNAARRSSCSVTWRRWASAEWNSIRRSAVTRASAG